MPRPSLLVPTLVALHSTVLVGQSATPIPPPLSAIAGDTLLRSRAAVDWAGAAPNGTIVAISDGRAYIYSPKGTPLFDFPFPTHDIGPKATHFGWLGDTLWVDDIPSARLTLLNLKGNVVDTRELQVNGKLPSGDPVPFISLTGGPSLPVSALLADGSMIARGVLLSRAQVPEQWARPDSAFRFYGRILPNGAVRSVVAWQPDDAGCTNLRQLCDSTLVSLSPHGDRVAAAMARTSGADSGTFTVTALRVSGDTIWRRRFSFNGVAVPQAYGDSITSANARRRAAIPATVYLPPTGTFRPSIFPPLQQLVSGTDGSTWVGLRSQGVGTEWEVMSPAGQALGRVVLPPGVRLLASWADGFMATVDNSDGTRSLLRYRIR